jgi:Cu/Ag efflux protein CusF
MQSLRARFILVVAMTLALCVPAGHAQTAEKKAHTFRGKVEKVDAESKMLVVNGENVEGWMAAMTMTYVVDKADIFKTVKVGDQITAKVYDGDFTLHDVQVAPPKSARGKARQKSQSPSTSTVQGIPTTTIPAHLASAGLAIRTDHGSSLQCLARPTSCLPCL